MSMIESVYRQHYGEVKRRLWGKVVSDKSRKEIEWKAKIREEIEQAKELERIRAANRKRLIDEAIIACATNRPMTAVQIMQAICAKHGISRKEFVGPLRFRNLVDCRTEVCATLKARLGMSKPKIGRLIGRDHSSVFNLLQKPEAIALMAEIAEQMRQVEQETQRGNEPSQPHSQDAPAGSKA